MLVTQVQVSCYGLKVVPPKSRSLVRLFVDKTGEITHAFTL